MAELRFKTKKKTGLLDITGDVGKAVSGSGVKSGICLVFAPHATAAIILNESEPNLSEDFEAAFARLFPPGAYAHNRIDGNAEAHLKSGFAGAGACIPVENGALALGTWQSVLLCEFDGPRERRVIVKVVESDD
ncbi:MAG: secondary thiamine-phosphate synthase enzyme YjbQ [Candidatus ainarchaeum sp.]|nr:secondary thiamine-phosphate synthase enzyme YjbQ [Candidatus ainarchaeum sp.]